MSAGFSSFTDEGTGHPAADATCWWCLKRVKSSLHDYAACHEVMRPPRRRPRTAASAETPTEPDNQQRMFT